MERLGPCESQQLEAVAFGDRRSLLAIRLALAGRGEIDHVRIRAEEHTVATRRFEPAADLCIIDAGTNGAGVGRARFARQVIRNRGVLVFNDRTRVAGDILHFLRELPRCRSYPLAHDLLVVEINVSTLLSDPNVRAQVPRRVWFAIDRLHAIRIALHLSRVIRVLEPLVARGILALAAPRRANVRPSRRRPSGIAPFEIHTFVNDEHLYEKMRQSFISSGFDANAFVALRNTCGDPYEAITRIGRRRTARFPILCHQDVRIDQGAGAATLLAGLEQLDAHDPHWVVAGNAGLTREGRLVRRLVDPHAGFVGESVPASVVTLDENFLVFNSCCPPNCSEGVSAFHLYGADASLNALAKGGSAYVIDFPVTHLSPGSINSDEYALAKARLVEAWSTRCLFRFVLSPSGTLFFSRSRLLRRVFGSDRMLAWVRHALHQFG